MKAETKCMCGHRFDRHFEGSRDAGSDAFAAMVKDHYGFILPTEGCHQPPRVERDGEYAFRTVEDCDCPRFREPVAQGVLL